MAPPRQIVHVDMDEFFAAVEKLDHPEYRGKPLLIGGDPNARGVVSTASYEARKFGCHSAQPMAVAIRLCPQAIVLPVRGQRYAEKSEEVFAVLTRFTPAIEPLSIDEAFLDLTGTERLLGPAGQVARRIKDEVRRDTGLTASVGLAPNKFLAKLASDLDKPDGLTIITPQNTQSILDPLPVGKLWGVGPATASQLQRIGVHTVGQLRQVPGKDLAALLGSAGEHLLDLARGIDARPVTADSQAKSIGQETTFARDVADREQVLVALLGQAEQVAARCRKHGLSARTITVKIRYGDFKTITRSTTLTSATNLTDEIWPAARKLFMDWATTGFKAVRLIGVTASGLSKAAEQQRLLFEDADRERKGRLDAAVDRIAERFGKQAIRRNRTRQDEGE